MAKITNQTHSDYEFIALDDRPSSPTKSPDKQSDMARTHRVAGNLLHSDSLTGFKAIMLYPGDTVTFGPEITDEEIQQLLYAGALDGPQARENLRNRMVEEAKSGMAGMTNEELANIWKGYLRQNQAARRRNERGEARVQEDSNAARLANITDDENADPLHRAPSDIA